MAIPSDETTVTFLSKFYRKDSDVTRTFCRTKRQEISFAQCIMELVLNSLNAGATSIAVRFHCSKRTIQVIDNGTGMSKNKLCDIMSYRGNKSTGKEGGTLIKIRDNSSLLIITSRHSESLQTYSKIFESNSDPCLTEAECRPSSGTTITIFCYDPLQSFYNERETFIIHFLIASIATVNLNVSFSIRDDENERIILGIARPHSPLKPLKVLFGKNIYSKFVWQIRSNRINYDLLFYGYIGIDHLSSRRNQFIFLNNRLVQCPLILNWTSSFFIDTFYSKQNTRFTESLDNDKVFILLFVYCPLSHYLQLNDCVYFLNTNHFIESIRDSICNVFTRDFKTIQTNRRNFMRQQVRSSITHKIQILRKSFLLTMKNSHLKLSNSNITSPINEILGATVSNVTNKNKNINKINLFNTLIRISNKIKGDNKAFVRLENNENSNGKIYQLLDKNFSLNNFEKNNFLEDRCSITLSNWSDWSYHSIKQIRNENVTLNLNFNFLPKNIHSLLKDKRIKITKKVSLCESNDASVISNIPKCEEKVILRHQEINVRPCKYLKNYFEFKLKGEHLKYMNVLRQINREIIAGVISDNNIRVLIFMDQHAIHERIRYEYLLERYKTIENDEYLSVTLKNPILIKFSSSICEIILSKKILLKKFGIAMDAKDQNSLIIRKVPKCLVINSHNATDNRKLSITVENLVMEIIEEFQNINSVQILPFTMHNAIASEACHGAIKFGEILSVKECNRLLKLLRNTKVPTQCAHGRPSIAPIMDLSHLRVKRKRLKSITITFSINLRGCRVDDSKMIFPIPVFKLDLSDQDIQG